MSSVEELILLLLRGNARNESLRYAVSRLTPANLSEWLASASDESLREFLDVLHVTDVQNRFTPLVESGSGGIGVLGALQALVLAETGRRHPDRAEIPALLWDAIRRREPAIGSAEAMRAYLRQRFRSGENRPSVADRTDVSEKVLRIPLLGYREYPDDEGLVGALCLLPVDFPGGKLFAHPLESLPYAFAHDYGETLVDAASLVLAVGSAEGASPTDDPHAAASVPSIAWWVEGMAIAGECPFLSDRSHGLAVCQGLFELWRGCPLPENVAWTGELAAPPTGGGQPTEWTVRSVGYVRKKAAAWFRQGNDFLVTAPDDTVEAIRGAVDAGVESPAERVFAAVDAIAARDIPERIAIQREAARVRQQWPRPRNEFVQPFQFRDFDELPFVQGDGGVDDPDWENDARWRRVVVLGEAGIGKSLLIASVAERLFQAGQIAIVTTAAEMGPLLAGASQTSFAREMGRRWQCGEGSVPRWNAWLRQGRFRLIVDAFDEASASMRRAIFEFLNQDVSGSMRFLLVSRPSGMLSEERFAGAKYLELTGFSEPQILDYLSRANVTADPVRWLERLDPQVRKSLLRVPVYLRFACLVADAPRPWRRRTELIEMALMHLRSRSAARGFLSEIAFGSLWDMAAEMSLALLTGRLPNRTPLLVTRVRERIEQWGLGPSQQESSIWERDLARLFDRGATQPQVTWDQLRAIRDEIGRLLGEHELPPRDGYVWTRTELTGVAERVLKLTHNDAFVGRDPVTDLLNTGLLEPDPIQPDGVRFVHLLLGEYLASRALARRANFHDFASIQPVLESVAGNPDWDEVIVLLSAQLRDPNPLLELLLRDDGPSRHRKLALAAFCLRELS